MPHWKISSQRPQRAQNSASADAAASLWPIRSAAWGGRPGRATIYLPSWRTRYRRIGPTSFLRQLRALWNSGRVAISTNISSRTAQMSRPRRQRPHWRQFSSRNATAPRRSAITGPMPLSGIWARNSRSTAPTPSLRQLLEPSSAGRTRIRASTTMMIEPGSMQHAPDAAFCGSIFARVLGGIQPVNCIPRASKFPRLWSVCAAVDSNFWHAFCVGIRTRAGAESLS